LEEKGYEREMSEQIFLEETMEKTERKPKDLSAQTLLSMQQKPQKEGW
jgi:hypothetical protein